MKEKIFGILLIVFSVFLGIALLFPIDREISIITSPKIYSFYHTENNEQFGVSFLSSKYDSYLFDESYFDRVELTSEDEVIPLHIHDLAIDRDPFVVDGEDFYRINLTLSLGIESNDMLIYHKESHLKITYVNEKNLVLYIGEFNYAFSADTMPLSMYGLKGTFTELFDNNTVSGVMVELYNDTNKSITINGLDCLSQNVTFNNDYLIQKDRDIDLFETPEEILIINDYDYQIEEKNPNKHTILPNTSMRLYVPILYIGEIKHIERFSIIINIEENGVENSYYVDDFIFMNQSHYGDSYESGYHYYVVEE